MGTKERSPKRDLERKVTLSSKRQKRKEVAASKKNQKEKMCHGQMEKDSSLISESIAAYLLDNRNRTGSSENFNYFCHGHVSRSDRKRFEHQLVKFSIFKANFRVRRAICFHRAAFEKGGGASFKFKKRKLAWVT